MIEDETTTGNFAVKTFPNEFKSLKISFLIHKTTTDNKCWRKLKIHDIIYRRAVLNLTLNDLTVMFFIAPCGLIVIRDSKLQKTCGRKSITSSRSRGIKMKAEIFALVVIFTVKTWQYPFNGTCPSLDECFNPDLTFSRDQVINSGYLFADRVF